MTSFSESRLELFMTKWQVVVSFDTLILQNGAVAEVRYSRIVEPRFSFSASDMSLTKDEFDYLKGFFEARKGKYEGFRFANPLDYKTSGVEVELAPDVTTQGVLIETSTAGEYQLVKRYTVAGVNCYKTIRKVKAGTTVFYSGGSPTTGPTIDLNSGIVTGASAGITVECEYDLPVRFDMDEIELELLTMESAEYGSYDAYRVIGLQLVEDNYPKVYGYVGADFTDLTYTFEPSPLPEVTKGTNTVTRIESSQSKKEARITLSGNKAIYKFGENALYQNEVDFFCSLFYACKGRKLGFTYDETGVRFASDSLTAQLELFQGNQSIWQLSGLELVATELAEAPPPPTELCIIGGTYETTLSLSPRYSDEPRETAVATFTPSTYEGDILTISNFKVDDFAFIVKPTYNVLSGYSLVGQTRTIVLPPDTFILYDGDNPNYASGSVNDQLTTNYIFNSQTVSIPGGQSTSVSEAIQGLIDIGVIGQPHNNIALSLLDQKGYVDGNGNIAFKIMLVEHGFGYITFNVSIPRCPGT